MSIIKNLFKKYTLFLLFLCIGLLIFFYPLIQTNFEAMMGEPYDVKLIAYLLESSYQWFIGNAINSSFWNAPFYYPSTGMMAGSDVLLGGTFVYAPIRFFVDNEFTAFQIWIIVVSILNYSTFYYLTRKTLKLSRLASALSSFLFAFSLMRYFRMVHPQFFIQFYIVLATICLLSVKKDNSNLKNNLLFLGFGVNSAIMFYTTATFGWFYLFFIIFAGLIALCFKETKEYVKTYVKTYLWQILSSFLVIGVLLLPLYFLYHSVVNNRSFGELQSFLSTMSVWFRSLSILDREVFFMKNLPGLGHYEDTAGIGLIATLILILAIKRISTVYRPYVITLLASSLLLLIKLPIFNFSLWGIIYYIVPGANGMRSIIRGSFIILMLVVVIIAYYIQSLQADNKVLKKFVLLPLITILMVIEQIPVTTYSYTWSKNDFQKDIDAVSKLLPKSGCTVFDYEYKGGDFDKDSQANLLAMWVGLKNHLYVANGYTGVMRYRVSDNPNYKYCFVYDKDVSPVLTSNKPYSFGQKLAKEKELKQKNRKPSKIELAYEKYIAEPFERAYRPIANSIEVTMWSYNDWCNQNKATLDKIISDFKFHVAFTYGINLP